MASSRPGRPRDPQGNTIKATGTIIESPDAPPGATGPTFLAAAGSHEYVIDVAQPNGQLVRAKVTMSSRFVHPVGAAVPVELNTKTGDVTVNHHAMSQIAMALMRDHPDAVPGSAAQARSARILPDSAVSPAEPGTFDPISAGRSRPGGPTGAFGEPVGSFALGDSADSFALGDPADSFGAFGAFDIGKESADQRIARLRQLLEKGQLTESEFQAQRQQIISGI